MTYPRAEHTGADRAFNNLYRKDYSAGLSFFRDRAEKLRVVQDSFLGAALWLVGDYESASSQWLGEIDRFHEKPREITHTDGAGGVLVPAFLWWASSHPGLEEFEKPAIKELKIRWKTKHTQNSLWPGSIANFILGGISWETLIQNALTRPPILIDRALVEAWFYISGEHLKAGNNDEYIRCLEKTAAIDPAGLQMEWFLARYEVEHRLRPEG